MTRLAWVTTFVLFAACGAHGRTAARLQPPLPAPALVAPAESAQLTFFPRDVDYRWDAVPGAARYFVEVDCYHCCVIEKWCSDVGTAMVSEGLTGTTYTRTFPGDQPGRWRVWAADSTGRSGTKSEWRAFSFRTRAADSSPPVPSSAFRDPATGAVYRGPGVSPPKAVYSPEALYTDAAVRDKARGVVVLSVLVDDTGRVDRANVRQSLRADLDENAVRTVKTWRFDPAMRDGHAVAAEIDVSMTFNLR